MPPSLHSPAVPPKRPGKQLGRLAWMAFLAVTLIFILMGGLWLIVDDFSGIQLVEAFLVYAGVVWISVFGAIYYWRKRSLEFAESKKLYEQIINASQDGILFLEPIREVNGTLRDLKISVANEAAATILGLPSNELSRGGLVETNLGGIGNELFAKCREMLSGRARETFEISLPRNPNPRWLALRVGPLKEGVLVGFSDITEQKRTLDELRYEGELLRITGRMASVGGWNVQFPSRAVTWSDELCLIHELPLGTQPALEEILAFYLPEGQELVRNAFQECLQNGTPYDLELELITAKGNRIWVRGIGKAEYENGTLRRIYGTLQNITEARQAKSRLEAAFAQEQELTRQARAAEQAKSEFLAMMSHEIRTPMNGILGFAEQLEQTRLPAEPAEQVRIIHSSSRLLLRIIDDILDFSRIESGDMHREQVIFSPVEVIQGILALLGPQAQQKGIELRADLPADLPSHYLGDPGHLRQILINLVGNAIKFTATGHIELRLRRAETSASDSLISLEFWVSDTGSGIPAEALPFIFQPFTQADSRIARRHSGSGLGLAISRRLAHLMDGTLEVRATSPTGTTIVLAIPLLSAAPVPVEPERTPVLDATFATAYPLRILVADDEPVNLKLICHVLRRAGYEPLIATNGAEAVALFQREHPDCVLMDMQMPEMDGMEATVAIRQYETEAGRAPAFIVALTANVMPRDRQRCLDSGMNEHLAKPMKKDALALLLKEAHTRNTSGTN